MPLSRTGSAGARAPEFEWDVRRMGSSRRSRNHRIFYAPAKHSETARPPLSGPPARQRAASLRPLARLARAAGQASWTVRITAAPPRAAGQPSLKELRCESSESEDERVGVDSSGGPCGRRSALLSRPPSRCPSAGFCAAARIEYCQRPSAAAAVESMGWSFPSAAGAIHGDQAAGHRP